MHQRQNTYTTHGSHTLATGRLLNVHRLLLISLAIHRLLGISLAVHRLLLLVFTATKVIANTREQASITALLRWRGVVGILAYWLLLLVFWEGAP